MSQRHGFDGRLPAIVGDHAPFRTPDGAEHKTWNAARKHLTGLDLLQTLQETGLGLVEATKARDSVMRHWNVSKRSQP
jgi:hypothetical protein